MPFKVVRIAAMTCPREAYAPALVRAGASYRVECRHVFYTRNEAGKGGFPKSAQFGDLRLQQWHPLPYDHLENIAGASTPAISLDNDHPSHTRIRNFRLALMSGLACYAEASGNMPLRGQIQAFTGARPRF